MTWGHRVVGGEGGTAWPAFSCAQFPPLWHMSAVFFFMLPFLAFPEGTQPCLFLACVAEVCVPSRPLPLYCSSPPSVFLPLIGSKPSHKHHSSVSSQDKGT